MKKIDELVIKLLKLKPIKKHNSSRNRYGLTYKDLSLVFWSMDVADIYEDKFGLVRVNDDEVYTISNKTRLLVLEYFSKQETLDDIIKKIDKEVRRKKLKKNK